MTRKRSGVSASPERQRLLQRRAHARRDLDELVEQVELGEIDAATAARLQAGYEQELADVEMAIQRPEEPPVDAPDADRPGLSPRRALIGVAVLMAAFTVAIIFIGGDTVPSQQGAAADAPAATAGPAPAVPSDAGPFAAMEEAVAADPGNLSLRLGLADAYFQQRQYSPALSHYLTVLESSPSAAQESVALARVGWMAFVTDQVDAARQYLDRSLEADSDNVEGKLFMGYVLFYGFNDAPGAIPLLEDVLAVSGLEAELRADVEGTLATARGAIAEEAG